MLLYYLKRGARTTIFYAASAVISRVITFLFLPYFLATLTLTEFGIWDFYQLFFSLGTLLLSSCATIAMTRFYLLYHDDPVKQKQSIGNALLLVLIGLFLFATAIIGIMIFKPTLIQAHEYLRLIIINILFFTLFALVLAYLRVKEHLWLYCIFFSGQSSIAVLLTVFGISKGFGITSFFYGNCCSYALFAPYFFYVLVNNISFSSLLLKQQILYSAPLLIYNLLYTGFFLTDRMFIKYYSGYDSLGLYALLWRFGAIFQFASMILMDAMPFILYSAQKEKNNLFLISKLITYLCSILLTGALISIIFARGIIGHFFPPLYCTIITYLPFFFLSLVLLEIARLMQIGFGLSVKTLYTPFITAFALTVQFFLLKLLYTIELWGIFFANSTTFLMYGLLNYSISTLVLKQSIIDVTRITKMMFIFCAYLGVVHILFASTVSWQWSLLLLSTWPMSLWITIVDNDERKGFKNLLYNAFGPLNIKKKIQSILHT